MEFSIRNIVLFGSVVSTALSAGLFYAWVISVIPGTKKISDQNYLETMQSINREILNPGFFIIFFGALVLLMLSSYLQFKVRVDELFYYVLTATLFYGFGTMGVTMLGNVPLNNILESHDLTSFASQDAHLARAAYEAKWNMLNLVRTCSALISFLLILVAFAKNS